MIRQGKIGSVRVAQVLENSGPTHDPAQLFPNLPQDELGRHAGWLAPNHYISPINRLIISSQIWVVHAGSNVIVIDTGVGNLKPRAIPRMNMLNSSTMSWLEAAGAGREAVTHVVHTHLHIDHVGWNTMFVDGKWVPTFPNARYLVPQVEFDYFKAQTAQQFSPLIDKSFADSVMPVVDAGLVDFIGESGEVADCLTIEPAPGHSPGMLTFRLRADGEEGIFSADILHNPIQIQKPELNTAYCANPDQARATRSAFLARAAERGALIMPSHFGAPYRGYVRRQAGGYIFEPSDW